MQMIAIDNLIDKVVRYEIPKPNFNREPHSKDMIFKFFPIINSDSIIYQKEK